VTGPLVLLVAIGVVTLGAIVAIVVGRARDDARWRELEDDHHEATGARSPAID
jgi:hypothetical protein